MTTPVLPQAWQARDLATDKSWTQYLTEEQIEGFQQALAHAKALDKPFLEMTCADFPLNAAARAALDQAFSTTQGRWGLCLLKGFPVNEWSEQDAKLAYWGIGLHVGVARTQNRASDIMTDVRDVGASYKTKNGRGYNTNASLDFHADSADVVALLTLRTAKSGGESKITSSIAVCEEIARQSPAMLDVLRAPIHHSYQGTQAPGQPPYYVCPILGGPDTPFALRANRKNTIAAERDFPELPRLTPAQTEALDTLDRLLADPQFCYSMWLEPGDLQLLNNYVILHSRTEFEDYEALERKRHLLRLWLAIPGSQPLPASWQEYFGDVRAGAVRGGVRGQGISEAFLAYERRQAIDMAMPLRQDSTAPSTPTDRKYA